MVLKPDFSLEGPGSGVLHRAAVNRHIPSFKLPLRTAALLGGWGCEWWWWGSLKSRRINNTVLTAGPSLTPFLPFSSPFH